MRKEVQMKDWHGIMTILELNHISDNGATLYRETNVKNIIHKVGEEYVLGVLFSSKTKPENYYVGLDSRSSLNSVSDIGAVIEYEPSITNAYERQAVASNSFQVQEVSGVMQARTPTLVFKATGGSWGPIKNIFIATARGTDPNTCTLISSAGLSREITVASGEIITMRMAMSLSNSRS